jgi:hypothetical protein
VNGAQVWTIIGVLVATLGAIVSLVLRVDAKIDGLRGELLARFDLLERELARIYAFVFERQEPPTK